MKPSKFILKKKICHFYSIPELIYYSQKIYNKIN